MTTANSQFFALLTAVGEAKQANAYALGVPWGFYAMGVGDAAGAEPVPDRAQTRLINEVRRAPLNQVKVDPANASIIIAEQVIPPDVGGWWIREIGLYDTDGDLVAVANCAPSFKPLLSQGTGKTQVVRLNIIVTSSANVQLKIDPAVVLATREYVDSKIISVLPGNKRAGRYTMVEINERGIVQQGYNPTLLADFGITDAMPKGAGGLMTTPKLIAGPIAALVGTQFISVGAETTDKPPSVDFGAGFHIKFPDTNYSFELLGDMYRDLVGFRRNDDQGNGQWRTLFHDGNFDPSAKADKADTLAGYGITDAMPKNAGGLMTTPKLIAGPIAALAGTQFISVGAATTDKPPSVDFGAGFHIKFPDTNYSFELLGDMYRDLVGFRRNDDQGNGQWRTLFHDGNFNPGAKADKAVTLAGYGIPVASQVDAESGIDNSKPATSLRVFQAVAKLVKQASETVAGVMKIATVAQVESGLTDDVAVSPKTLRLGFWIMTGRRGYIVLPSWLGGFIMQWQPTPVAATADVDVLFPIPFPREVFGVFTTCDYAPESGVLNYHASALVNNSKFVMRSSVGASASGFAFSVGC